jgi:hypothetical protein
MHLFGYDFITVVPQAKNMGWFEGEIIVAYMCVLD